MSFALQFTQASVQSTVLLSSATCYCARVTIFEKRQCGFSRSEPSVKVVLDAAAPILLAVSTIHVHLSSQKICLEKAGRCNDDGGSESVDGIGGCGGGCHYRAAFEGSLDK